MDNLDILLNDLALLSEYSEIDFNKPNIAGLCICGMLNKMQKPTTTLQRIGDDITEDFEMFWLDEMTICIRPLFFSDPEWSICKLFGEKTITGETMLVMLEVDIDEWRESFNGYDDGSKVYVPLHLTIKYARFNWGYFKDMNPALKDWISKWFSNFIAENRELLQRKIIQSGQIVKQVCHRKISYNVIED